MLSVFLVVQRLAGNHVITLDKEFYTQYRARFYSQISQAPAECHALSERRPAITYLCHESAPVRLKDQKGARTEFTVFGSPYNPQDGTWAFSYLVPVGKGQQPYARYGH